MAARALALIDIAALRHNFSVVQQLAPNKKIMAMVKANAYGHGVLAITQYLPKADYFGVACIDEAIALREAGIGQQIVLMAGFQGQQELDNILTYGLQTVVYDWQQLHLIKQLKVEQRIRLWLKIDTGMHRLGFPVNEAEAAWEFIRTCASVDELTIMTHLAMANHAHDTLTELQIKRFLTATQNWWVLRSAANSAALMQYPESQCDIVRPGLMLYGVSPRDASNAQLDNLQAVMTLKSRVIATHHIDAGDTVGYSATWQATRPSKIATVSIGYGDGYPQFASNGTPVMIRGQLVPLVGRVSMDMLTVDVTDHPDIQVDDEVILWGKDLPIEKVAEAMHASPYALLAGVSPRVKRQVVYQTTPPF